MDDVLANQVVGGVYGNDIIKNVNDWKSVAAGAEAVLSMPVDRQVKQIVVMATESGTPVPAADIDGFFTHIQLHATYSDGSQEYLWDCSMASFLVVKKFYKISQADGRFLITFYQKHFEDALIRRASGLGTADISKLELRLRIAGDVVSPDLKAEITQSGSKNFPRGSFVKIKEERRTVNGTGFQALSKLPLGEQGDRIKAIHIGTASATQLRVKFRDFVMMEASIATVHERNKENATHTVGRNHQTGFIDDYRLYGWLFCDLGAFGSRFPEKYYR